MSRNKLLIVVPTIALSLLLTSCGAGASTGADTESCLQRQALSVDHGLSDDEQIIYEYMVRCIGDYETSITMAHTSQEDMADAYEAVIDDYPEYFWVSEGCSIYSRWLEEAENDKTVTITPSISADEGTLKKKRKELETAVNNIIAGVDDEMSEYDKALYIHDYIIDTTDYDLDSCANILSSETRTTAEDSETAYGCLVNHKAVCSGYAAAYQLLLQQMGIRCARISTPEGAGDGHEWNCVWLDDRYMFVDVTWDDPVSSDGSGGNKTWDYFGFSLEEMLELESHEPDTAQLARITG